MIIYTILSAIIFVLAVILDPFEDVTTFFGLEDYIEQFSGTIQNLGVLFPPVATLSTCIGILLALFVSIQAYHLVMRLIKILRG